MQLKSLYIFTKIHEQIILNLSCYIHLLQLEHAVMFSQSTHSLWYQHLHVSHQANLQLLSCSVVIASSFKQLTQTVTSWSCNISFLAFICEGPGFSSAILVEWNRGWCFREAFDAKEVDGVKELIKYLVPDPKGIRTITSTITQSENGGFHS